MPESFLMRLSLWIASLWPGFVRAWVLGRWEGLLLAIAFATAFNIGLITTFVRLEGNTAPMGSALAAMAWLSVLGFWALGAVGIRRDWHLMHGRREPADPESETLFRDAQNEYLKGHWIEAETLVARLIARAPADVEARLLLASIKRRTKRWDEAKRELVQMRDEPAAARWLLEIDSELRQIDELKHDASGQPSKAA
jgi:hypothetical protein